MPITPRSVRAAALALSATLTAVWAATPDPTYQALRQAPVGDVFLVENLVLRHDVGTLTLKNGVIGLTAPVKGRDTVAVFSGEAEFTLTPATALEKTYLKNLTEQESVKESFDRALFCFTDDTGKEIRSQAKTRPVDPKLTDILGDYRRRLRKESNDNVEAQLLADLYNEKQPGFFSAYIHGRKHNELQFHVKPRGAEPALGPEEVYVYNVQPAGIPDEIWYHAHLQSEIQSGKASSDEDHRSVSAESYTIQTDIARNDHFTATTRVRLRALMDGERVLPFGLVPTLRISKVSLGSVELPFIQEDKKDDAALSIILPEPLKKDAVVEIALEYQGDKVVRKEGGGNFAVGARESWYPTVNTFHDHAKFDLTFRIPKQYTLVSVGKLEKSWTEKDVACTHWVSEIPLAVAGFNYGTFKKKTVEDSTLGVSIEGYAASVAPDYLKALEGDTTGTFAPSSLMDGTLVDAQNALRVYRSWFGKSEFDRIAITQQPEFNFGQSWPSLVYLPMLAYLDSTQRYRILGMNSKVSEFVDEVAAHEVAHQYWGHMVGWSTYHDQWLSEGFATFSAGLFLQYTRKNLDSYQQYWEHARKFILEKNEFGRRPNDAGPLWMGHRLSTEKNPRGYRGMVYEKGGYVLHMLRHLMYDPKEGDRAFVAMMQDFVQQHLNRNASTESFQRVVEKHIRPNMNVNGNGKMDWFFNQWVYGSAIPKYKLDYNVTEEGGKIVLKGSVAQSEVPDDFVMPVPIYLDLDGQIVRLGAARIVGNSSVPLQVNLPKKPKRVLLNYYHDVLEQ
jgi:hypothetical protein